MRVKTIEVFSFNELNEEAKERAINDYVLFMLETTEYEHGSENFRKAIDKAEAMQTPWFTGSYIYEYCQNEILDDLKSNNYEFTSDGIIS